MTLSGAPSVRARFRDRVQADEVLTAGDTVLVAVSGGVDSVSLLHLLRFTEGIPDVRLEVAHFDHGMRPESASDAAWVEGVCRAWGLPVHPSKAESAPTTETEARDIRYDFLLGVKEKIGAAWLLTGHQADDQAETVLHRVFRGTGLWGLAGIPATRSPGIYRPLLPFSRADLIRYAARHRVSFREDRTNLQTGNPRNFLRHAVLPTVESGPFPVPREALVRLGRLAGENEEAWESLLPSILEGVRGQDEAGTFVVREALLAYHPAVRARLLRAHFGEAGIELDEAGTRVAVEFTTSGASGRFLSLPGGRRWIREFDRFRLDSDAGPVSTGSLSVAGPEAGNGYVNVGGASYEVVFGPDGAGFPADRFDASVEALDFPLTLRGWEPGDRIEFAYGTKKLKKIFGEAKLPVRERERVPVLLDGLGRVLWVPGIARSTHAQIAPGSDPFFFGIRNADEH